MLLKIKTPKGDFEQEIANKKDAKCLDEMYPDATEVNGKEVKKSLAATVPTLFPKPATP